MTELIEHILEGEKTRSGSFITDETDFTHWYPRVQGYRFNHVISADFMERNSNIISNPIDRKVVKAIRSTADLIVTTGKTVVAENVSASALAPMLIITRQMDLNAPATIKQSEQKVFVTSDQRVFGNPSAEGIGPVQGNLLDWLKNFCQEYKSVVLETGLETTLQLQSLIDELCLTVVGSTEGNVAEKMAYQFVKSFDDEYRVTQLIQIDTNWFFRFENESKN